jgi:hypothetical protein
MDSTQTYPLNSAPKGCKTEAEHTGAPVHLEPIIPPLIVMAQDDNSSLPQSDRAEQVPSFGERPR